MVSTPSFDPQAFENQDNAAITHYLTDKSNPLFGRASEGTYPPGSTFKLVVASGALEEGAITADTIIEDTGYVKAGASRFGNWAFIRSGKTEGLLNVVTALKRSNDIFFYKVGEKLGVDNIQKWADIFGYDKAPKLGIEATSGLVPSQFWKQETLKDKWYLGDTYNLSIGQGYLLVSPLQVALATVPFANNGYYCEPRILKSDEGSKTDSLSEYRNVSCHKLPISRETLTLVQQGMKEACATGGTAWPLFDFAVTDSSQPQPVSTTSAAVQPKKHINLACKTGTAETNLPSGIPYAWLTIYAPAENPEIVMTVMIEEGGEGSDVAAPIVKELLKDYFERTE
jgi:penicillin-binding protein 2